MRRAHLGQLVSVGLVMAGAFAGCATLSLSESVSAGREGIAQANRTFEEATRKGDVEKIASLYTPDAIAFPPDAPMARGRDSIKQLWSSVIRDMGLKSVDLKTLDLDVAGDTAYEVGEATLRLEPKAGQATNAVVKYVVVWKRVDGQWRLHRDIWNANPPK